MSPRLSRPSSALLAAVMLCAGACVDGPSSTDDDDLADRAELLAAPALSRQQLVVDRLAITAAGGIPRLDIDGDGDTENAFGAILRSLQSQPGAALDLDGALASAVSHGQVIQLLQLDALGTHGETRLTTRDGSRPQPAPCAGPTDAICGGHLHGNGVFQIAPTSPTNSRVDGTITAGRFVAGPGSLALHLPLGIGNLDLRLASARVDFGRVAATGVQNGVLGGAIAKADVDTVVIPYFARLLQHAVEHDCTGGAPPSCGCASDSLGRTMLSLLDRGPADCRISAAEVASSPLTSSLFAPDLDVAPRDGVNDSLSAAFAVTAVPASFPQP